MASGERVDEWTPELSFHSRTLVREHQYKPVVFVGVEPPFKDGLRCSQDDELLTQRRDVIEHVRGLYEVLVLSQQRLGSRAFCGVGDQYLQRCVEGLKFIHLFG